MTPGVELIELYAVSKYKANFDAMLDEQVIQVEGDLGGSRLSLMRNFENYNQMFTFEVFNNITGEEELDNCFWIKA